MSDIVEHGSAVRASLSKSTKSKFIADATLQKAAFYDVLCISEAVTRLLALDPTVVDRHPTIPWRQIADIGNVLRHEYGRVDPYIVWDTVTGGDLDDLIRIAERERQHS